MLLHKLESLPQYLHFLHVNPAEPSALCEDILIHVTGFFREPEAFQALAREIFPKVFDNKAPGESIRVWVPGCSTGEETYSVAMVLLECLGDRVSGLPIQIFGTDISEVAIEKARAGVYNESGLVQVSPERLRRFFVKVDGGFQIAKSLREMCVFAAGPGPGPSVLAAGPHLLPQRPHLHGAGAPQESLGHFPLRS